MYTFLTVLKNGLSSLKIQQRFLGNWEEIGLQYTVGA